MAQTGILQRRDIKVNLIANPPIEGEIVYATDTREHGWVSNAVLYWKKLDLVQPIVTVEAPPTGLETDPIGTVYLVVTNIVSIDVTPQNGSIASFNTTSPWVQYTATATYGDGSTADVTTQVDWTSSNVVYVTIDDLGLATYIGGSGEFTGNVDITASLNGVFGTAPLDIYGSN